MDRINRLLDFLEETIDYFSVKFAAADRDRYTADRDLRNILDKTINDIILCLVDISEELLKIHKRTIPDTYKDTILACYEFAGDIVLKIAPLVKHRNEMIHQYLKMNWQNIVTVHNRLSQIREFASFIKDSLKRD